MIFPEFYAFYSENFCKFSRTLFRKYMYPQLLNTSINFNKLFFSVYITTNSKLSQRANKNICACFYLLCPFPNFKNKIFCILDVHKYIEIEPSCSHELATFLKYFQ